MARVSSAPEDAFHFKGTFADGWGEVIDAKAVVFQFPPRKEASAMGAAGTQDPPALYAELTIERLLNGDGAKTGVPPEQVLLSIQKPSKDTGDLDVCHPGNYPDGNLDADPVDCTGALGAEGNTLFAMQDGYQLNDKCKWMTFTQSLQEKGFKPAVLKRTYFPDLVGLRAYFKTETRKKFRDDQTNDPTVFVVTEIKRYPYEQGAGKATAKRETRPAAEPPAATDVPAPASAATAAPPNGVVSGTAAEDIAAAILTDTLAPSRKGKPPLKDMKRLKVEAMMAINAHKPAVPNELKKDVMNFMSNEDWLIANGIVTRTFEVQADGKVQFTN